MSYWYCENPSTKSTHKSNYMFSQYNCPNDADAASKCCVQGCSSNCIPDSEGENWCAAMKKTGFKLVNGSGINISSDDCPKLFQDQKGSWSQCYSDKSCDNNRDDCIKWDCEKQGGSYKKDYYQGEFKMTVAQGNPPTEASCKAWGAYWDGKNCSCQDNDGCGKNVSPANSGNLGGCPGTNDYWRGYCTFDGHIPTYENRWARLWGLDNNGCCYANDPDFTPPEDCAGSPYGKEDWSDCAENITDYLKKRYGIATETTAGQQCVCNNGSCSNGGFSCLENEDCISTYTAIDGPTELPYGELGCCNRNANEACIKHKSA